MSFGLIWKLLAGLRRKPNPFSPTSKTPYARLSAGFACSFGCSFGCSFVGSVGAGFCGGCCPEGSLRMCSGPVRGCCCFPLSLTILLFPRWCCSNGFPAPVMRRPVYDVFLLRPKSGSSAVALGNSSIGLDDQCRQQIGHKHLPHLPVIGQFRARTYDRSRSSVRAHHWAEPSS